MEDIEVGFLVYTRQDGAVGMLPKSPFALIARMLHMIMGYPQRIAVQLRNGKIAFLELIRGIDDGADAIMCLQTEEEEGQLGIERALLQTRRGFLHIDDGRKVAFLQRHMADEEVSLHDRVGCGIVEVVGTSDESLLAGCGEVLVEAFILMVAALRSLDEDEADGDIGLLKRSKSLHIRNPRHRR